MTCLIALLTLPVSSTTQCPLYQNMTSFTTDVEYQYSVHPSATITSPQEMVFDKNGNIFIAFQTGSTYQIAKLNFDSSIAWSVTSSSVVWQ